MLTTSPRRLVRPPPDRQEAAVRHFPYIEQMARRLRRRLPRHMPLEDMVSAGFVGLMESVDRFDPRRSASFDAYAAFRIKAAILDALRAADPLSRDHRASLTALRRAQHRLVGSLGREPEPEELARELGCGLEDLFEITSRVAQRRPLSLREEVPAAERPHPSGWSVTDCFGSELRLQLSEALEALPERHRQVIYLHYYEDLLLREIGELLGVTESRVCQIHGEAMKVLRAHLAS